MKLPLKLGLIAATALLTLPTGALAAPVTTGLSVGPTAAAPEPTFFIALGLGLVGLVARRVWA